MWFYKKQARVDEKEEKIQKLRDETFRAVDKATEKTQKVNTLLEGEGTTYLVFLATGGEKRVHGKR